VGLSRHDSSDGWHQPDELSLLASAYENDAEPSAETAALLRKLSSVGSPIQDQLGFVG
jgi:hypothetical protein